MFYTTIAAFESLNDPYFKPSLAVMHKNFNNNKNIIIIIIILIW